MRGLEQIGRHLDVDVLVGAAAPRSGPLAAILKASPLQPRLHRDADDVGALMAQAGIGVLAMGTTTYEACCLGLPSINICPSQFHAQSARLYEAQGVLATVGEVGEQTAGALADCVARWLDNDEERVRIATRARAAVDGNGVGRIADNAEALGQDESSLHPG
jgi:spore coat polysaccharide biosynthesis predicted glycosyltransferase SpsG